MSFFDISSEDIDEVLQRSDDDGVEENEHEHLALYTQEKRARIKRIWYQQVPHLPLQFACRLLPN